MNEINLSIQDAAYLLLDLIMENTGNHQEYDISDARVVLEDWKEACKKAGMPRQRYSEVLRVLLDKKSINLNPKVKSLPVTYISF